MDPATLGVLGLAGSVGQGLFGAIGASQQGSANAEAARYQAQVARNNRIIADQNAAYAATVGGIRAQARDFRNRAVMGQIETAQGASGIDVASPSFRQVREGAANIGRLDTETLMNNAMQEVRAYQAQGTGFEAEARLDEARAQSAESAGTIGAFSSLLGGASSFADKWLRYQNVGISKYGSAI